MPVAWLAAPRDGKYARGANPAAAHAVHAMYDLYPTETPLQVLFVTGLIGGGAAWLAGRAIAQTWRPFWHVVAYMALLGAAVRFVHFALFDATLLSPESYAADTIYLLLLSALAWRMTRAGQMATQYYWLYERTGPMSWRERAKVAENPVAPGPITR
jgi:hypothetical protein